MACAQRTVSKPHGTAHCRLRNQRHPRGNKIQAESESHAGRTGKHNQIAPVQFRFVRCCRCYFDERPPPGLTMSSSRKESSSATLLAGIRILVGRARHQASVLSAGLKKLGAVVIEVPFIEIRRPSSYQPLDTALKAIAEYDWLIL